MTKITVNNNAEPDTPASGRTTIYADSVTKTLKSKDDTGAVLAYGDTKKVFVSSNDTTENYLGVKIQAGSGIGLSVINEGGNEHLELSSSALGELYPTGLISGEALDNGIVSINGADATLFDIIGCGYFIRGIHYTIANQTGVDPSFGAGENSSFIGLNSSGFIYSSTTWTHTQLKTIIPIARVNAASGQTGSGSTITLVRDDRFFIDQQGLHRRYYHEQVFGALYHKGGLITASTTALQLNQSAGKLFDAQGKEQLLINTGNLAALKVFHTGGAPDTSNVDPLIVDTGFYDNGTDLTAIPSNKWVCHTLLKSPKAGGFFFFVYGTEIFNNQTEARFGGVTWSIFVDQSTSGLIPVARIIVQQGATVIADGDVRDERPFAVGGSGGATTAAISTMDQSYEASITPQIHLNSTQGGIDIRDASTPLGTDLWSVKDNAGVNKFLNVTENGIDVNGNIIVTGTVDGRDIAADGNTLDNLNTDHNNFTNIDGGAVGEYYHMTSAQHTEATQYATLDQGGLVSDAPQNIAGDKSFFGKLQLYLGTAIAPALKFWGDGSTGIFNPVAGNLGLTVSGIQQMLLKGSGVINLTGIKVYADDTAAGTGGLVTDDLYRTATGEMRIKL